MSARLERARRARGGWTLVEVSLVSLLTLGVVAKAAMLVQTALGLAGDQTAVMHYEDQARRVIDQIALAVMGSERGKLVPQIEEIHSSRITYTFAMGVEDGDVVFSEPEEIRLDDGKKKIEWIENPGAAEERRVVWTNLVSPLLGGEEPNGIDDNGNGLVDEDGLSFVLEGARVVIRLTLRRPGENGRTVIETVESVVTCRN